MQSNRELFSVTGAYPGGIANTDPYLKASTERRGFFASGKEDAAGNTVCIPKAADEAWHKKARRELMVLLNRQLNNADLIKDLKAVLLAAARQPQNMANITPAII